MQNVTLKYINSLISSEQQQNLKFAVNSAWKQFMLQSTLCLQNLNIKTQNSEPYNTKSKSTSFFQTSDTTCQKNIYFICFQNRTCYFYFFEMVKCRVKTSENRETACSRFAVLCWQTFSSFQHRSSDADLHSADLLFCLGHKNDKVHKRFNPDNLASRSTIPHTNRLNLSVYILQVLSGSSQLF